MKILDKFIKYIIFLLIFVFIGLPFLYVFKEAFTADGGNSIDFILNVFKENKNLFVNSITVGFIVSVLTTVFSAIIGLYCFLSGKIHQKIISAILLVTMITPPFVTSLSYINLFGRRGFITYNLLKLNTNPY
ncbi:MAG: iron ABC transporter permease, partial [Finegoldia magna]|nr:iron ABC transporter permease [Finegoldia magna]